MLTYHILYDDGKEQKTHDYREISKLKTTKYSIMDIDKEFFIIILYNLRKKIEVEK